jgi:hypothetical protein
MKRNGDWLDDRDPKKQQVSKPWRKIEKQELNLAQNCDVAPLESVIFIDDTHANYPSMKRSAWYRDVVDRNADRSACYNFISWLQPGLSEEAISAMYSQIDLWTRDGVYYFFRKPSHVDLPMDALAIVEGFSDPVQRYKMRGAAKGFKPFAKPDCAAPILYMDHTLYWQIKDLIKDCGSQFDQIIVDGPLALEAMFETTSQFGAGLGRLSPLTNNLIVTSVGVSDAMEFTGTNLHVNELVVGDRDFNDDNWFHFFEWRPTKATVGRWVIHHPEDPALNSLDDVVSFIRKESKSPIYLGVRNVWDLSLMGDPRFDGFIVDPAFRSSVAPDRQNVIYREFGY